MRSLVVRLKLPCLALRMVASSCKPFNKFAVAVEPLTIDGSNGVGAIKGEKLIPRLGDSHQIKIINSSGKLNYQASLLSHLVCLICIFDFQSYFQF
jgi:hypothetical protein